MTERGRLHLQISEDGRKGALVMLICESELASRSAALLAFLERFAQQALVLQSEDLGELLRMEWPGGGQVRDALIDLNEELGEGVFIAKVKSCSMEGGYVGGYIHHDDKTGVIGAIKTSATREATAAVLKQVGMHATALAPKALSRDEIDAELVERETAIYREEVKDEPAEVQDTIIRDKLDQFFAGVVLREQPWVMDDSKSVQEAVMEALGEDSVIGECVRLSLED